VGQRVLLLGRAGPVRGVIGKKAVHQMKKEEMDKVSKVADLWIDIGAANKAEAVERVRVGDAGVLDSAVQEYPNGRVVSRSIDNRIGAYVVAEAVRRLRGRLHLSQEGLARQLGLSVSEVRRWDQGLRPPSPSRALALGKLAGSPDCWVFWELAGVSRDDVQQMLGDDGGARPARPRRSRSTRPTRPRSRSRSR